MATDAYPICWIRLGEGAPPEPGVYLRAADVAGWLDSLGYDDLAELLADESQWPATESGAPRVRARRLSDAGGRGRHVASPKQWQAIIAAKQGPCRVCGSAASNGRLHGLIQFHHVVSREDHGDDLADNIVPLCPWCHSRVTARGETAGRLMLASLTDAEYAYMIERGGEGYAERAYGLRYTR